MKGGSGGSSLGPSGLSVRLYEVLNWGGGRIRRC